MKRTICLFLTAVILTAIACLAACDNGEKTLNGKTPYELYQAAAEYVDKNIGRSVQTTTETATGSVTMADGSVLDIQYYSSSEVVRNDRQPGENGTCARITDRTETTLESGGQQHKTVSLSEMSFLGNDMYIDATEDGVSDKAYANISYNSFMKAGYRMAGLDASSESEGLMEIAKEWFRGITYQRDGDLYYYTIDVDGVSVADSMSGFVEALGIPENADINTKNCVIKVYFDARGNLDKTVTSVDCECKIGGTKMAYRWESVSTYTFDNIPKVTRPADVTAYPNLTKEIKDMMGITDSDEAEDNQPTDDPNVTKALFNIVYDKDNQYITWEDTEKDQMHNWCYHIFLDGKEVEQLDVPTVDVLKHVKTAGSYTFRIEKEDLSVEGNKKTYNTLEKTVEISKDLEENIRILDRIKEFETDTLVSRNGRKLMFISLEGNGLSALVDCGDEGFLAVQERIEQDSSFEDGFKIKYSTGTSRRITEFADTDKYNALQSIIDLAKSGAENVPDDIKSYLNAGYDITICKTWQEQHHCHKRGDELSYNVIGILKLQKFGEVKYVPCVYNVWLNEDQFAGMSDLEAYKEIFFAANTVLRYRIYEDVGAFDTELEKFILRSGLNWDIDKEPA